MKKSILQNKDYFKYQTLMSILTKKYLTLTYKLKKNNQKEKAFILKAISNLKITKKTNLINFSSLLNNLNLDKCKNI
jgi:hypothetical protein